MSDQEEKIFLSHGSGGKKSHDLIQNLFFKYFDNEILNIGGDSAILNMNLKNLAFTTDSFVVDPLIFPGGDIGKLAVCGTVNDLSVSGAVPKYLSVGFIIEEGLQFSVLEQIVKSMAKVAKEIGVKIVTGDTKVVNRGKCDKIFINTAGIGELDLITQNTGWKKRIEPGDKILINGPIADHGIAVMSARNELKVTADIKSDCAPLNGLIQQILEVSGNIKFMRDATRGGLATVLAEISKAENVGINIFEDKIPVRESVRGMCEIFGFDPLYVANEGKAIIIVSPNDADKVLKTMRKNEFGNESQIIGEIESGHPGKIVLYTHIGGKRIVDMLSGDQLPRIC